MYTKEKNTEKSKLTDNVERINCEACYEPCIFELKDSVHTFNIGLLDILKCIKFAEDEGIVPKLPEEWWISISQQFGYFDEER